MRGMKKEFAGLVMGKIKAEEKGKIIPRFLT